jgi:multidrug efflux pump subunit AcrB
LDWLAKAWQELANPGWANLRAVGNLRFLKVSYILLVFVPVLTSNNGVTEFLGFAPWVLAVTFFASLFLALANVIYDVGCPAIIKRFESPNDLYERMLQIRELSQKLYPGDGFEASLHHCKEAYKRASTKNRYLRVACGSSYWVSVVLFVVLFANRAYVVITNL